MANVLRTCPVCSIEYTASEERLKHNRQTTCSRACSYKRRAQISSEKLKGKAPNITSFKNGLIPWNKTEGLLVNCKHCNKEMRLEPNQYPRKKFCSKECSYAGRELKATFKKGEQHPAWQHGLSLNKYPSIFSPKLKRKIRARDGFKCVLCGITEQEHLQKFNRVLSVNHIDFDKNNCCETNLNTLCTSCNTKINWDRPKWADHFQKEMNYGK